LLPLPPAPLQPQPMTPIFRVKGSAGAAGIAVLQSLSIVSSIREWLNVAYGRCCGHSGCTGVVLRAGRGANVITSMARFWAIDVPASPAPWSLASQKAGYHQLLTDLLQTGARRDADRQCQRIERFGNSAIGTSDWQNPALSPSQTGICDAVSQFGEWVQQGLHVACFVVDIKPDLSRNPDEAGRTRRSRPREIRGPGI